MKRICFVAYDMSVIGGVEQVITSLSNSLCEKYEVYVYSINLNHGEKKYTFSDKVRFFSCLSGEIRLRNMIRKNLFPFIRFVKNKKIDAVLMMENYAGIITTPARFFTKAKYIYCDHGALMNQWHRKDIVAIKFIDSLFADKVVTLTERTRRDFIEKFHIKKNKIQYIYNWIEPQILENRKEYNVESKTIVSAGRFSAEKGFDLLVQVAEIVMRENPEWKWEIYGEGDLFDETEQLIREKKLQNQVILKGSVKNVSSLFGQYSFFVLTSYREGLPLTLLEAKGSGIPMVSFDIITGPREIINDGQDGFLIEPYNVEEMAKQINLLISSKKLRSEMAKATLNGVSKFDKINIIRQWEQLIDNI